VTHLLIWIAVMISALALAAALVAAYWAHQARALAEEARLGDEPPSFDEGIPWRTDDVVAYEPSPRQQLGAVIADADCLSKTCHVVIGALDAGGEPPTSNDYARIHRYSDLLTISIGRIRGPHGHGPAGAGGDLTRMLTDELVTLHHCLVTEVRQHQEARFPFVGARDTTLASQMLRRFDAELARLWLYTQTGSMPEPNPHPVDFETVRFVPRDTPTPPAP
jgi:hypothetical protein